MFTTITPTVISLMVFLAVFGLVAVMMFVFRDNTPRTATRLDMLVGKRRRDDEQTDILRNAAFEGDRKSFLDMLTPRFFNPRKMFEQVGFEVVGVSDAQASKMPRLIMRKAF